MALSDPWDVANLRTELQARADSLNGCLLVDPQYHHIPLHLASLADTAAQPVRSVTWIQKDDQVLAGIMLRVTDGTASRVVTARLTCDDDARGLLEHDISVSVTTSIGTQDDRELFTSASTKRVRLLRGLRYRLEIENTSAGTTVSGPLSAVVTLESKCRGGSAEPVTLPHGLSAGGIIDAERLSDDLQTLAAALKRSQDNRYTYSTSIFLVSGMDSTDDVVERQIAIATPGAGRSETIDAVEFVIGSGTAGIGWTLSKPNDDRWASITIEADTTDEVIGTSELDAITQDDATEDLVLQLDADGAGSITYGYVVIHWKIDRWAQNVTLTRWSPAALSTGAALQADLDLLDASIVEDISTEEHMRPLIVVARNIAGTAYSPRIPGSVNGLIARLYAVAPVGTTARLTVGAQVVTVAGTGATSRARGATIASFSAAGPIDTPAGDLTVTLDRSAGAGTILLMYAVIWFR